MNKICHKCGKEQPIENFVRNKNSKDGYHTQCKACYREYNNRNKVKISEYMKEYHKVHKEEIKAKQKEQRRAYSKSYREKNKEKESARVKKWKERNKDSVLAYHKEYNKNYYIKHKIN